jgi:hypothetical protein
LCWARPEHPFGRFDKPLTGIPEGPERMTFRTPVVQSVVGPDQRRGWLVLASVVPLLVIAWVVFVDLEAALIMLLTLPLVPVFMRRIGRYTEQRTKERWQALRLLSSHWPSRSARPSAARPCAVRTLHAAGGRPRQPRRRLGERAPPKRVMTVCVSDLLSREQAAI